MKRKDVTPPTATRCARMREKVQDAGMDNVAAPVLN
jgi:hypothetical protein